ncbi:MAG: hypothetical protein DHS20C14_09150 [Phycisphaeraceae bacterium]|nr:MAG: hypothetical protein DHS20C14_09150 [Phycisphaeraceae bacterium]
MLRVIIAAIVGGIIYFAWGFVFWPLGVSNAFDGLHPVPNEAVTVAGLDAQLDTTGMYYFPEMPTDPADEAAMTAYSERHEAGPIGMVMFRQEGTAPMAPVIFVQGIAIDIIVAFLVSMIAFAVSRNGGGMRCKAVAVCAFAIGAALASHGMMWNWFYMPTNYTLMMMTDVAAGWVIAGLVIALIVRAPKCGRAEPAAA